MDPLIGEAQTALLALNLVVHHQHTFVLFEGDSFQVLEALNQLSSSTPDFLTPVVPPVKGSLINFFILLGFLFY